MNFVFSTNNVKRIIEKGWDKKLKLSSLYIMLESGVA